MFSALAAVCTVDCAIEIVLIILHYITLHYISDRNYEHSSKTANRCRVVVFLNTFHLKIRCSLVNDATRSRDIGEDHRATKTTHPYVIAVVIYSLLVLSSY